MPRRLRRMRTVYVANNAALKSGETISFGSTGSVYVKTDQGNLVKLATDVAGRIVRRKQLPRPITMSEEEHRAWLRTKEAEMPLKETKEWKRQVYRARRNIRLGKQVLSMGLES